MDQRLEKLWSERNVRMLTILKVCGSVILTLVSRDGSPLPLCTAFCYVMGMTEESRDFSELPGHQVFTPFVRQTQEAWFLPGPAPQTHHSGESLGETARVSIPGLYSEPSSDGRLRCRPISEGACSPFLRTCPGALSFVAQVFACFLDFKSPIHSTAMNLTSLERHSIAPRGTRSSVLRMEF